MRLPRSGALAALLTLALACQSGDGGPTDVDRSLETQGYLFSEAATEIFQAIQQALPRRQALVASADFADVAILLSRRPDKARAKAQSLVDYLLRQHGNGNVREPQADQKVGGLVVAIAEFAGLSSFDAVEGAPAAACTPGLDCELFATVNEELAAVEIPGDAITQPFVLYMIRLPDDFAGPPHFPLFYEIGTIPEGIEFPSSSPAGSLTLSAVDDAPVAGLCALDEADPLGVPADAVPGQNLFLAHQENGVWEQLPYVPVTELDCAEAASGIGASASMWASPIDLAIGPILDLLSPAPAKAGGRGLGGAISSFSPFGAVYTGEVPTSTTIMTLEGGPVLHPGDPITLRAVVSPTPPDGPIDFLIVTRPVHPAGATTAVLVGGVAEHTFVCGDPHVRVGHSYTATGVYRGSAGFGASESTEEVAFSCQAAED